MPLTRLANTAIDRVKGQEEAVVADIMEYAATDLLCYRANWPEQLAEQQEAVWGPILGWLYDTYGARLQVTAGVMHVPQPENALALLRAEIARLDAFALTAMHNMTTLMASCVLALAVLGGQLSAEEAWRAAHLDEDWQISQWGEDAEARSRRESRWNVMSDAARLLGLLNTGS